MGASKSALKGFAGIFAVGAVIKGLKDVTAEAREAQKVGALTAQAIKTTGGVANVSAAQVSKLADSISRKTGIDDEAIQSGSNLLLAFTKVRNEAGKGAAIFDRATQAAVDLSARGFGSITSVSKQLGKALSDPEKGLAGLTRAGVKFTKGQESQIKAMAKSGDLLGAQKLILQAVEQRAGGAAAASATAGEKMKAAWNQAKEGLGTALLPAIDAVENAITTKIIPSITKFVGFLQKNPAIVKAFGIAVAAVAAGFVIAFVAANALIIGLSLLGAAVVAAYVKFPVFRNIVNAVFNAIKVVVLTVIKVVVAVIKAGIATIKGIWAGIKTIVGFVKSAFNAAKNFISGAISAVKNTVSSGLKNVITFFKNLPGNIAKALGNIGKALVSKGKDLVQGLINGIKSMAKKVVSALIGLLPGPIKKFAHLLGLASPSKLFKEFGEMTVAGYVQGIDKKRGTVLPAMGRLADTATLPSLGWAGPRLSAVGPTANTAPDRPIYTDAGMLLGWVKTVANGEARLVWAQSDREGAMTARFS